MIVGLINYLTNELDAAAVLGLSLPTYILGYHTLLTFYYRQVCQPRLKESASLRSHSTGATEMRSILLLLLLALFLAKQQHVVECAKNATKPKQPQDPRQMARQLSILDGLSTLKDAHDLFLKKEPDDSTIDCTAELAYELTSDSKGASKGSQAKEIFKEVFQAIIRALLTDKYLLKRFLSTGKKECLPKSGRSSYFSNDSKRQQRIAYIPLETLLFQVLYKENKTTLP